MKKSHFLGEKGWDWDTPLPPHLDIVPSLSQVWPPFSRPFFRGSNKLLNWWDIAPPFMYYVFHHIYGLFQGKLSFGQFWWKVGIGWDPLPLVGTKSQLSPKSFFLQAPLRWVCHQCSLILWYSAPYQQFIAQLQIHGVQYLHLSLQ